MPIITQSEVKELLQIPTATITYDNLIATLIPIVQEVVVKYCKITPFINANFQYRSNTIAFVAVNEAVHAKITDSLSQFVEKDLIAGDYNIRWSKYNNKIVTVETVEAGTLTLADGETLVTEAAENFCMITKVEFPNAIKLPVARLISESLTQKGKLVKSESLPGGYSVVYLENEKLMSMFNQWRSMY